MYCKECSKQTHAPSWSTALTQKQDLFNIYITLIITYVGLNYLRVHFWEGSFLFLCHTHVFFCCLPLESCTGTQRDLGSIPGFSTNFLCELEWVTHYLILFCTWSLKSLKSYHKILPNINVSVLQSCKCLQKVKGHLFCLNSLFIWLEKYILSSMKRVSSMQSGHTPYICLSNCIGTLPFKTL